MARETEPYPDQAGLRNGRGDGNGFSIMDVIIPENVY
jgi:hypothetical protein